MPTALITIAKNGAITARTGLELTGHNIANVSTAGYTRRTGAAAEVAGTGGIGLNGAGAPGGARTSAIVRGGAPFQHAEVRRTGSDLARAEAELKGLAQAETVIEQSALYPAMTRFEASLARLTADPLSGAGRADALEQARGVAQLFNHVARGLEAATDTVLAEAATGVAETNRLAAEVARTNVQLAKAQEGGAGKAALLDQRDQLLGRLAEHAAITCEFDNLGRATVRAGGAGGPLLVAGTQHGALVAAQDSSGVVQFAVDGEEVLLGSGSLAGHAQALERLHGLAKELDAIAARLIAAGNAAQAGGATPDGSAGPALFAGVGAGDIALALASGDQLATAAAASAAGSRDTGNLKVLRDALAGSVQDVDRLLFTLSSAVGGRATLRDGLRGLADAAQASWLNGAGVDLDTEAVNLLRFQQAFQANGKVIQTAAQMFDTMLRIA